MKTPRRLSYRTSAYKFYGMPNIHKKEVPLRPLVSSRGSVTYEVTKELSRVLKPLVGKYIYHVNNSKEFADEIRNTKLEEGGYITSFDVTSPFTSIPAASALQVIKVRLEQEKELPNRIILSTNNILGLLGPCLTNTYFLFHNQFFKKLKELPWGYL